MIPLLAPVASLTKKSCCTSLRWSWPTKLNNANANGGIWPKKSSCTSLRLSWPQKYFAAITDGISITWCGLMHQGHHITNKFCLDLRNTMLPLTVFSRSHATYASIMWHWHQWCNMTKGHVAPHFICLNLRKAMLPLMILLASWDTDAGANGIKWPKGDVTSHISGAIFYCISIMWCSYQCQWHHMTKTWVFHLILIIFS